jgi:kynurenine formamidase
MCHACVTESVKARMLGRRDFFRLSAGVAAAATAATALPAPARAAGSGVADMTHALSGAFPTFFGEPQFFETQIYNFAQHGFNLKEIRVNEHTGTHMDAPLHFSADGQSVDAIPPERLVCPLCVVDIRAKAADNPDAQVTPDDLKAWIAAHGPIPPGACVAMNAGWDAHVATPKFRNADAEGKMHFPGFHVEAAQMLMEEADVAGLAVDTLSLDYGISADFATHYAWLPTNRWGIECIANLGAVPAAGATLVVGAPKHAGGTGGPARIFTLF